MLKHENETEIDSCVPVKLYETQRMLPTVQIWVGCIVCVHCGSGFSVFSKVNFGLVARLFFSSYSFFDSKGVVSVALSFPPTLLLVNLLFRWDLTALV